MGFSSDEVNFDLTALLSKLNIATLNEICINFNKFKSIDILHFDDLSKFLVTSDIQQLKEFANLYNFDNHTIFISFIYISFYFLYKFKKC